MIIGLLNLQGDLVLQNFVQRRLQESGLLSTTDTLYYSHSGVSHHNAVRVRDDKDLYLKAKFTPDAMVWSLSTEHFKDTQRQSLADWLQYELFFIVDQWQLAVQKLQAGYEGYGVNLYLTPEPHYEAYCFWMQTAAMSLPKMTRPYVAFQSFTNHYIDPFPASEYLDFDSGQPAPFANRRLQERLALVFSSCPAQINFGTLAVLLMQAKCYFDAQPSMRSERPYVLSDVNDQTTLAFAVITLGRVDIMGEALRSSYQSLGWVRNVNFVQELDLRKADIIYTAAERISQWLPKLSYNGVIVIRGVYRGKLPSQQIGEFTLVAQVPAGFAIL